MKYTITFLLHLIFVSTLFGQNIKIDNINDIKKYKKEELIPKNNLDILINKDLENSFKIFLDDKQLNLNQLSELKEGGVWYYNLHINNKSIEIDGVQKSIPDQTKVIIKLDNEILSINYENTEQTPPSKPLDTVKESDKQSVNTVNIKDFKSILSDAKILFANIDKTDLVGVTKKQNLIKTYNIHPDSISNHKFLRIYSENIGKQQNSKVEAVSSNIAKTDVTNFATGMARFLADRAKQELNETFFIQMHKQMQKIPELQVYFPESYIFLKRLDAHSMSFDLNHMRSRFNQDIHNLPINLYTSLKQSNISNKYPQLGHLKNYLDNDPHGILINYALGTVLESQGKINPKNLIYDFAHSSARKNIEDKLGDNNPSMSNVINTIKLAELISSSLLSADPNRYWVTEDEIKELFTNDSLFQTYIGLVLAKANFDEYNIRFGGENIKDLIEEKFAPNKVVDLERLAELKNIVRNMYYSYKEVDNVVSQLKNMDKTQAVDESYKLFNVFKNNLVVINNQLLPVISSKSDYTASSDIIHNYIAPAVDISYNMYAKKFGVAIKEFVVLLQNSLDVEELEKNKDYKNFLSKFSTYGTLIANVATAQNSDEVKAAIEASVLPVGSSRIKRNSNWSITANAFVGGFYGRAFYKQEVNGLLEKRSVDTFGITAPMGISFSKGNLKVFKQNSALGINLQLIDLGCLVNFYMQEGDGASLPRDTKIQLGDIIAPGGSISYSIGDTPFTLLGGVQYVPNLSRMEVIPTNTDFKPLTWRMHIGVAIDIPLFNLKIWN